MWPCDKGHRKMWTASGAVTGSIEHSGVEVSTFGKAVAQEHFNMKTRLEKNLTMTINSNQESNQDSEALRTRHKPSGPLHLGVTLALMIHFVKNDRSLEM